jgi:hypothetical protein
MKQQTGFQCASNEVHREAMVLRRNCVETTGYEVVVPKGNAPNSGKTVTRRYSNLYYFENGL